MKQKATQLIRDNAPWLKELSFGCEVNMIDVEYEVEMSNKPYFNAVYLKKGKQGDFYVPVNDMSETFFMDNDEMTIALANRTIIGHPITIGDVLRVIRNNSDCDEVCLEPDYESDNVWVLSVSGNAYYELTSSSTKVDLSKTVDNQSDEFYRSIVELLGKE